MSGVRAAGSHDDLQQDKKHNATLLDGIQSSEINIDNILHKRSIWMNTIIEDKDTPFDLGGGLDE